MVSNELEGKQMEVAVTCFQILRRNLRGRSEETRTPQAGQKTLGPNLGKEQ
jgi:hypothetical protein